VPLVDELDFEELALNMESLYAKLPNKKVDRCAFPRLRACEAQTSAACKVPEGKKVTNLLCVGTVCCMWMKAINFWNQLWQN